MSKAVLVMDMPCNCDECAFREYSESTQWDMCIVNNCKELGDTTKRPDWCPLKPLPERANHPDWCDAGRYDKGYNACIDELLGEKE